MDLAFTEEDIKQLIISHLKKQGISNDVESYDILMVNTDLGIYAIISGDCTINDL